MDAVTEVVQPLASVTIILCRPAATLLNAKARALVCGLPPSKENLYGAEPFTGVTIMVPPAPHAEAAVELVVALNVLVRSTVTLIEPEQLLLPSVTTTVCGPWAILINV